MNFAHYYRLVDAVFRCFEVKKEFLRFSQEINMYVRQGAGSTYWYLFYFLGVTMDYL